MRHYGGSIVPLEDAGHDTILIRGAVRLVVAILDAIFINPALSLPQGESIIVPLKDTGLDTILIYGAAWFIVAALDAVGIYEALLNSNRR